MERCYLRPHAHDGEDASQEGSLEAVNASGEVVAVGRLFVDVIASSDQDISYNTYFIVEGDAS